MEDLAFAHGDLLAADQKPQRALQDVGHLLALVRVHRHEAAALEINLGDHLALAGHEFPRQHLRHFFERDLVPSMQTNGLGAHMAADYIVARLAAWRRWCAVRPDIYNVTCGT